MLWLDEEHEYILQAGECIEGALTYCKDELNPRNICIDLKLVFPERFGEKKELTKMYMLE